MSNPAPAARIDPESKAGPPTAPAESPVAGSASTVAQSASAAPASVPAANPVSSDGAYLWLRRGDRVVVWLLVSSLLLLLGLHWLRLSRWGSIPVEVSSQLPREYYYSLDINTASWVEWAQLDGIGEKLARRIVADREERGPFRSPAEVRRVRGIGPKLLDKIKPFLRGGTEVVPLAE